MRDCPNLSETIPVYPNAYEASLYERRDRCSCTDDSPSGGGTRRRAAGLSERGARAAGASRVEVIDAVAVPAHGPIVLDGRFNEEIWQQAPAIVDFQQREPAEGQPPTMRTEARMAYDAVALYVAVRAYDTDPDKLVGILTRRDQRSPSDWIRIVVDSYFDKRSAYEFGVNPVGVKTRSLLLQRRPERRQLGCGVGRRDRARRRRLARGVQDSVLAAAFQHAVGWPGGVRRDSRSGPPGRDGELAAAVAQRQRLRLAVR